MRILSSLIAAESRPELRTPTKSEQVAAADRDEHHSFTSTTTFCPAAGLSVRWNIEI